MHQDQMLVHQQTVMEDWLVPGNLKNIFLQISNDNAFVKLMLTCLEEKVKCPVKGCPQEQNKVSIQQRCYSTSSSSFNFLVFVWRIRLEIVLLQATMFAAFNPTSTQELKPIILRSTALLLVSLGQCLYQLLCRSPLGCPSQSNSWEAFCCSCTARALSMSTSITLFVH